MAKNIEVKARTSDLKHKLKLALKIADGIPESFYQKDTFFYSNKGRIKLREFGEGYGELIYYIRDDSYGPKESEYFITKTSDTDSLLIILDKTLGIKGIVEKNRTLILCGQTRIHLDQVEGLGSFIELEVILKPDQQQPEVIEIAEGIIKALDIGENDLVDVAYIDLILGKES